MGAPGSSREDLQGALGRMTRELRGDVLGPVMDDPLVLDLLKEIKGERAGEERLFANLTRVKLRALFQKALTRLGVEDSEFVIHSLRHGGAARDHMYKVPQLRGN
jgi:integrase